MSAQGARGAPTRGYRRRKAMLDLNAPPSESREHEGTSSVVVPQEIQVMEPLLPAPIDVEALDDDVVESSPRAFAQAKHNAQRAHERPFVVDVDSGRTARMAQNNRHKRRIVQSNQTIINCDLYVNLESSSSSMREDSHVAPKSPSPPPKEPTFNCPICMGPLVEPTSTKCGHIFCKGCIKTAIAARAKCPTCRKRVTVKELIRVFLPAAS